MAAVFLVGPRMEVFLDLYLACLSSREGKGPSGSLTGCGYHVTPSPRLQALAASISSSETGPLDPTPPLRTRGLVWGMQFDPPAKTLNKQLPPR